ncbi:hypothetical protein B0H10DRAFT_2098123 [Mycena sp. CBHHK59/15]|nr:hypothetical protein B0H10DRAFT_2098123 [Mycena sp. CBHHK59/15]
MSGKTIHPNRWTAFTNGPSASASPQVNNYFSGTNRRRSSQSGLAPRPRRSSPLAGPALSCSTGSDAGVQDKQTMPQPRGNASAFSSRSPSLLSLQSLEYGAQLPYPTDQFGHKAPEPRPRRESKVSFIAHPPAHQPPSSAGTTSRPSPPTLDRSTSFEVIRGTVSQPLPILKVQGPSSSSSCSSYSTTPPSTRPGSRESLGPRPDAREPAEHWLTYAPYDATPRFSRLGLAAPGVVMPVHKGFRRPKSADAGSVRSFVSTPSLSSSVSSRAQSLRRPSTPKLVFTPPPHEAEKNHEVMPEVGYERGSEVDERRKSRPNTWRKDDGKDPETPQVKRGGTIRRLWRKLSRSGQHRVIPFLVAHTGLMSYSICSHYELSIRLVASEKRQIDTLPQSRRGLNIQSSLTFMENLGETSPVPQIPVS